jgi:glycosyl-4,4'-diaponeurosporenoate acyltransferase
MLVELPLLWTIIVDTAAWLVIHLGVAYTVTQLPAGRFDHLGWLYRPRSWEDGGKVYERVLAINKWKRRLPDGAALFKKGFRKKRLVSKDPAYLRRFRTETCRAELSHWVVIAFAPLFFLWNPVHVGVFMIGYALAASLPFIVVQRYNRYRFNRILKAVDGSSSTRQTSLPGPLPTRGRGARWQVACQRKLAGEGDRSGTRLETGPPGTGCVMVAPTRSNSR